MKKALLIATLATGLLGTGWVAAQGQAPAAKPRGAAPAHPGRGPGMGGGMMGMQGMGMGMGGMCPMMMGGADTKIDVKNVDKGVTITMTSTDAATAARLQKMAEAMRLMHEAMTP